MNRIRRMLAAGAMVLLAAVAAKAQPEPGRMAEVRELWTGSLYTSTYRVGVCISALGGIRGVVRLQLRNGQVDLYHITGQVKDGVIRASHSSGHSFKGQFVSRDSVEGFITLRNGLRIRLEGRRQHDAPLAPEDCAPLP